MKKLIITLSILAALSFNAGAYNKYNNRDSHEGISRAIVYAYRVETPYTQTTYVKYSATGSKQEIENLVNSFPANYTVMEDETVKNTWQVTIYYWVVTVVNF